MANSERTRFRESKQKTVREQAERIGGGKPAGRTGRGDRQGETGKYLGRKDQKEPGLSRQPFDK